jgi:hypothetical protein
LKNPVHNKLLLLGRACAGKDTFADYLVENYGYTKISFATPIYTIAKDLFDMKQKDRPLLQAIGQYMRQIKSDVFVTWAYREASKYERVVIADCRQGNEYNYGVDAGFLPVRISAALISRVNRALIRDAGFKNDSHDDKITLISAIKETVEGSTKFIDISKWENESENGADGKPCIEVINDRDVSKLHETAEEIIFYASTRQMIDG